MNPTPFQPSALSLYPMTLSTAQSYAAKITTWLQPYCTRIETAGSIRRQRPNCNDIDLVCIPKVTLIKDLLGIVIARQNHLREFLLEYVRNTPAADWRKSVPPEPDAQNLLIKLPKCDLDLWMATEETWATRLMCRTGSMQHNIWLAERAKQMGGKWNPYHHLQLGLITLKPTTETELYAALNLPYIPPEQREPDFLQSLPPLRP